MKTQILFVDCLTARSLAWIVLRGRRLETIWYFEPLSRTMQRAVCLCSKLGLIRACVQPVTYQVSQMRDATGACTYTTLVDEARVLYTTIRRVQLVSHPVIQAMGSLWDPRKVVLYLERLAERELTRECLRIGLVMWIVTHVCQRPLSQAVLLVQRGFLFTELQTYAHAKQVRLVGYRPFKIGRLFDKMWRLACLMRQRVVLLGTRMGQSRRAGKSARTFQQATKAFGSVSLEACSLAVRYWYRTLRLDPTERSELFWLPSTPLAVSKILVYSPDGYLQVEETTRRDLKARGVETISKQPRLNLRSFLILGKTLRALAWKLLTCHLRFPRAHVAIGEPLLALAYRYASWYGFFLAQRVKIHIAPFNPQPLDVAIALALDEIQGVSISYQYSISNLSRPTPLLSAGEHVQFVFSPLCEQMWRDLDPPAAHFVHTGFVYDGAFQALRDSGSPTRLKSQLHRAGARFILCFFDENSSTRWDMYASHADAMQDYTFLLQWILADPTLGLLCKVKYSTCIFQRIAPIADLITQVQRTGRCVWLTSDAGVSSIFPAEAAMAADCCVGKLIGSTAAFEAQLVGVPAVLIDTEGFRVHPLRSLGIGRVVFNDWPSLKEAVERYRRDPSSIEGFGMWNSMLNELDSFRDGRGTARITDYLAWLLEEFSKGRSRDEALARTAHRYRQAWGDASVTTTDHRPALTSSEPIYESPLPDHAPIDHAREGIDHHVGFRA